MIINRIEPYIGTKGTYAAHFQENPDRKIKTTESEPYIYNVKPILETSHVGDRKGYDDNYYFSGKFVDVSA